MSYLAIDLGGSFIKLCLFDENQPNVPRELKKYPFPAFQPSSGLGFREVSPQLIFKFIAELIQQVLRAEDEIEGILFSSQMHGLLLCDALGNEQSPFISWQDRRALECVDGIRTFELMRQQVNPKWIKEIGNEFTIFHPISKLDYLSRRGKLSKGLYPVGLADWLIAKFCRQEPCMHPTQASSHGAYHLGLKNWHQPLIDSLGLSLLNWPKIVQKYQPIGMFQIDGMSIPCYPSIGDHQAALWGSDLKYRELSLNVATGAQVSLRVDQLIETNCQVRPYFGNSYLKTITHLPAGRVLNSFVKAFSEVATSEGIALEKAWQYFLDQELPNSRGLRFEPNGFFAHFDSMSSIQGITEDNFAARTLFSGLVEGISKGFETAGKQVSQDSEVDAILITGGLAKNIGKIRKAFIENFKKDFRIEKVDSTLLGIYKLL